MTEASHLGGIGLDRHSPERGVGEIGVGTGHWLAPPLPPNRTSGSPASGSPVSSLLHYGDWWIPIPGLHSPTGNINVTAALAVMVFVVAQVVGVVKLGPIGYFKKKFLMPGAPLVLKIVAIPIMGLVLIAEPFSLCVRLFANMTAGHMVLLTFATAQMVGGVWLLNQPSFLAKTAAVLPFGLSVILVAFELFVAFIQAFIFTLLSALYLSESLEEHH